MLSATIRALLGVAVMALLLGCGSSDKDGGSTDGGALASAGSDDPDSSLGAGTSRGAGGASTGSGGTEASGAGGSLTLGGRLAGAGAPGGRPDANGGQPTVGGVATGGLEASGGRTIIGGAAGSDAIGGSTGGMVVAGGVAGTNEAAGGDAGAPRGVPIPARIEAEDFARVNEIEAPNDTGDCSIGSVDLGTTDDDNGGCYLGWTQPGEWVEYDVWVESPGAFELRLRLAAGEAGRELEVSIDGTQVGTVSVPSDGWTDFSTVTLGGLTFEAGSHTVRLTFVTGQTNINYLVFDRAGSGAGGAGGEGGGGAATGGSGGTEAGGAENGGSEQTGGAGGEATNGCDAERSGYSLVWSDEFAYEGLPDPERWGYEVGGDGWGNGELQYYTEGRLENASVGGGLLTLTAVHEDWEGNSYTSAKLNSSQGQGNPGAWNQGVIEIRARLPGGLGTWPAFWMMPNDCDEGWPNCGEIDVMEHVGYEEGVIYGTIHTDAFNHVEGTQVGGNTQVDDATSAFHVYTLVWTAERLEWLVDGEVYQTVVKEAGWGFAEWPFDEKPFHLKLNIAVGGAWGGAQGVEPNDFPTTMDVDYVCVYQAR